VVDIYDAARRIVPTGMSERFTRIEIELFSGRSIEAKRSLYRSLVENLAGLGVPELETKIIFIEVPLQNWGLKGGFPASETAISFKMDV
jgi:phenylpyruvate tautomerase PptA (4-oxalocrotonate tautomerase family)